jgi:hypothetical protein
MCLCFSFDFSLVFIIDHLSFPWLRDSHCLVDCAGLFSALLPPGGLELLQQGCLLPVFYY